MHMLLLSALSHDGVAATQSLNPLQKLLGGLGQGPMIFAVIAVFYFMLIRPQQKKQKGHEEWVKRVGQGDEVITSGGLVGKVTHVADDVLTIEVGDKVRVRVMRSHVTGPAPTAKASTTTVTANKASA